MRDHLIYCLEKGFFSQLPTNRIGRAPTILKTKDHLIPINCDCGSPDTIEDMIGCEGENGRKGIRWSFVFKIVGALPMRFVGNCEKNPFSRQ
jgi:hypothetical protein